MKNILAHLENFNYLFIDDVLMTGIVAKGITSHYDFSDCFLNSHTDSTYELLSPTQTFYTPQLLAAMDLNATSIMRLQTKAKQCYDHPKCYVLLNEIPIEKRRPKLVSHPPKSIKLEL